MRSAGTPTPPTTPGTSSRTRTKRADRLVVRARAVPVLRPPRDRRRRGRDHGQRGQRLRQQPDRRVHRIACHPARRPDPARDRLGGVAANVLNIYSGALSFTAIGFRLPLSPRRAIVALGFGDDRVFPGLERTARRGHQVQNFLLVIAYWIAPVAGRVLLRSAAATATRVEALLFNTRYTNWAGPVAMLIGGGVSIWLFANQTEYIGPGSQAQSVSRRSHLRGRASS